MLINALRDRSGGAERLAVGLAASLSWEGHDVTMCVTRKASGAPLDVLTEAGVGVLTLDRGDDFKPQAFIRLIRYLRKARVDVLHAHMFGSNVWGTVIGRLCAVPVVVAHEQTWSYEGNPVRRLLDGYLIGRAASAFVAVSSADADRMVELEKVPPEKVAVIPNAYIPRPDGPPGDLRAELGLPADVPLLVTAAILRPQKALDVLIDAFALVLDEVPAARLAIAGAGPCEEELRSHTAARGLTDRVHFVGLRKDVSSVLESADLAVMSSDFEGTPLFAIECMTHRTPLVATDVGGICDLLKDEESVLLAPRRDPQALARQIVRVLLEPGKAGSLAAAAYERANEFSLERTTARFTALYSSLLERAGVGSGTAQLADETRSTTRPGTARS